MLIITRKIGEAITIGDNIRFKVARITGNNVSLAVSAPMFKEIDQTESTIKIGGSINIGNEIEIFILGIQGRQVRLGIKAPEKTVVHREEIYVKIKAENDRTPLSGRSTFKPKKPNFLKKTVNSFGRWLIKISK